MSLTAMMLEVLTKPMSPEEGSIIWIELVHLALTLAICKLFVSFLSGAFECTHNSNPHIFSQKIRGELNCPGFGLSRVR